MLVEVSVPEDNVMTEVAVWRNDSTGRELVRVQPSVGFESRPVFDYEAPYGESVTYDWEASYYDPADNATTFSEPFTSWPGSWTGDTGDGSVLGGVLTVEVGGVGDASTRTVSAAWDSITVEGIAGGEVSPGTLKLYLAVILQFTSGDALLLPGDTGGETLRVSRTATGIIYTYGATVVTRAGIVGDLAAIVIANEYGTGPLTVGEITVETFATVLEVSESSAPVVLSSANAWLIAPQAPGLSVKISDNPRSTEPQVRQLGTVRNADRKSYHDILGSSLAITTANGPAGADQTTLQLRTFTRVQELAVKALTDPQLPILIRIPPTFGYDFSDGFYAVGDLERSRVAQIPDYPSRIITMPLTAVESPEVDVENPGWSWAQLAAEFATWAEVKAAFATWADVAVNNRRPGS